MCVLCIYVLRECVIFVVIYFAGVCFGVVVVLYEERIRDVWMYRVSINSFVPVHLNFSFSLLFLSL